MINSYKDSPTAYHQLVRMKCVLDDEGIPNGPTGYQFLTIPGNLHSFAYWGSWDHLPNSTGTPTPSPTPIPASAPRTVGDDVIQFLKNQAGLP